jgi:hypothetical protein
MAPTRADRAFRHDGVSYLDYKSVEMDRVLTWFLARLRWHGHGAVIRRTNELTIGDLTEKIAENPKLFSGFEADTTRRWLETHLLDLVYRGRPNQALAAPRPLHGLTYQLRNGKRSRSYHADEQLYAMLVRTRTRSGPLALELLRKFFFAGHNEASDTLPTDSHVDVETQALLNLTKVTVGELTDRASGTTPRTFHPPLVPGSGELLAEDTVRLLRHGDFLPRSVLVDYLKILFAFHLALYHLHCAKQLPALLAGRTVPDLGGFFLDVAGIPGTEVARLAERSAASWYGRLPDLVRSTFMVRKLDDLARQLVKRGRMRRPPDDMFHIDELLPLLARDFDADRETFGAIGVGRILDGDDEDDPTAPIRELGLDDFTTYIEMITYYRGAYHLRYLRDCVDSLLLKDRPGAMIHQPKQGRRRFVLDSRLLEVLLQIALLRNDGGRFMTAALRVDEFLEILRERYGIHIDRLPGGDGFERAGEADHAALRENYRAFLARLREIGFYSDLSDAYVTQTITPRYVIGAAHGSAGE